jgi:hypothetical protein
MARPLRKPTEIKYPEKPWQGIARVTVRRKDFRFDGQYGSPESVEQHAEWVRIYDQTGIPPEIETVRASLHLQRERISLPLEYEPPEEPKTTDRFPVAMMATAITCTLVLSMSLVGSSLLQPQPTQTPVPTAQTTAQQHPVPPATAPPANVQLAAVQPPVVDGVQLSETELAQIRRLRQPQPSKVFVSNKTDSAAATGRSLHPRLQQLESMSSDERARHLEHGHGALDAALNDVPVPDQ